MQRSEQRTRRSGCRSSCTFPSAKQLKEESGLQSTGFLQPERERKCLRKIKKTDHERQGFDWETNRGSRQLEGRGGAVDHENRGGRAGGGDVGARLGLGLGNWLWRPWTWIGIER